MVKKPANKKASARKKTLSKKTAVAAAKKPIETPVETQVEPPTPAPEKENSGAGLLWGLALFAVIIGGGYATLPLWQAYVPGLTDSRKTEAVPATVVMDQERDALNTRLAVMIERLQSLERQLADVRKMVNATTLPDDVADAGKSLQQLSGRLSKIEQNNKVAGNVLDRLNRLEQDASATPPRAELSATIGQIAKRLENLETGSEGRRRQRVQNSNAQALVLAVGQLHQVLASGAPYVVALRTLQQLGGSDGQIAEAVASLQAHAANGVPSLKTLDREYSSLSDYLTQTANNEGGGFFDITLNRLKSLVKISPVENKGEDPATGSNPTDRATEALRQGDLAAAVASLEKRADPAAPVLDWIRRAKSRLAAERSLALLNVYAVSLLTPAAER